MGYSEDTEETIRLQNFNVPFLEVTHNSTPSTSSAHDPQLKFTATVRLVLLC